MPGRKGTTGSAVKRSNRALITRQRSSSKSRGASRASHELVLFDNAQFIYELALSEIELEALGVDFNITNGLRHFDVHNDPDTETLRKRLAYFKLVDGEKTDYWHICQKNRTRSVNQYLTHWIYPYKGKFHPQMIRALLNVLNLNPGDVVLDPFIGSGTAALEAQLLGIHSIGIDVSSLCIMQTKVKTQSIHALEKIRRKRDKLVDLTDFPLGEGKTKDLYQTIMAIRDMSVRSFYLMAYLIAVSDRERRNRNFNRSFVKNVDLMIGSVADLRDVTKQLKLKLGDVDVRVGDSRHLDINSSSIDGIVTSPPYSIALDYVANDAHALSMLRYDLNSFREQFVGVRGKGAERVGLYNEDMIASYKEMYRVLKSGKFAAIVIGNATYNGQEVKTVEFTIEQCEKLGFKLVRNIDKIIFGLYSIMQKENILIFRKR